MHHHDNFDNCADVILQEKRLVLRFCKPEIKIKKSSPLSPQPAGGERAGVKGFKKKIKTKSKNCFFWNFLISIFYAILKPLII